MTRKASETSANVATSVMVAAAATPGHPAESALVAGVLTALQPLLERGLNRMFDVLRLGAQKGNRTPEELVEVLGASPEQEELLFRALDAARVAASERKRNALADSLLRGALSSEAALGETQFVRLLEDLDEAHIAVLKVLSRPNQLLIQGQRVEQPGYVIADLDSVLPQLRGHHERVLAVLVGNGLVRVQSRVDLFQQAFPMWLITDYGLAVLGRLEEGEGAKRP